MTQIYRLPSVRTNEIDVRPDHPDDGADFTDERFTPRASRAGGGIRRAKRRNTP